MKIFLPFNFSPWQAADAIWILVQLSALGQKIRHGFCFWLLASLLLSSGQIQAQTYSGSLTLSNQTQVNNFNYTEVSGNLHIQGADITDLTPLNTLTKVEGNLDIRSNRNLSSLAGLEKLTSVGSYLTIYDNNNLSSLASLENLTSLGGSLAISSNSNLTSLAGLENLTSVREAVWIYFNNSLSSLAGLKNLTSVGRYLVIVYNHSLSSLAGLDNLTSVGEYLYIGYNGGLSNLAGLDNLTSVKGSLTLYDNNNLSNLAGLKNLTLVGGNLDIGSNGYLSSLAGLEKIASVGGNLYIQDNSQLSQCCLLLPIIKATKGAVTISGNATNCNSKAEIEAVCAPVISSQPRSATVCAGEKATFRVAAAGTALSYQWQKNGQNITGATASTYTITAVTAQEAATYTVIVANAYTAVKSQAATLTVNPLPKPTITAVATSNVYTGGNPKVIYLGYGAQSVKLQASGGVSYSWSPASGLSKTTGADPVFTPTKAGTYTFAVTATNNSGCTAQNSVTITVIDARYGTKKNQVLICHSGKMINLDVISVPDHLAHGDQLGSCSASVPASAGSRIYLPETAVAVAPVLKNYPNPFSGQTTIAFSLARDEEYTLAIYDLNGTLVKQLPGGKAKAGKLNQIEWQAANVPAGLYLVRLTTATSGQQLKLMVK